MALRIVPVNDFDAATLAVLPGSVSTLPATNLQSNVRDDLWRSVNTEPHTITGSWAGSVKTISHASIWPSGGSSCLIGSQVRLELFSDESATTSVYDTGTVNFFEWSGTGYGRGVYGAFRLGAANDDRTARLAPWVKWFTPVYARSFRVTLTNTGAMDTPFFEARRIWLGEYHDAPFNAQRNMGHGWASGSEVDRNRHGPLRRLPGGRWMELRFDAVFITEADRAKWSDIHYACDPANEIFLSLFPTAATERQRRAFTAIGSLAGLERMTLESAEFNRLPLTFLES